MSKLILPAAVLATMALVAADSASAGWRRAYRRGYYAPAPATTYYTPAPAPAAPAAGAPVASAPTYRSYSYEPAPINGGTYSPGQPYVQPHEPSQAHFYRADRKMHGLSWYRNPNQ
jgi:hypothetical protein